MVFVAAQREIAVDALRGDELLEERCRKLDGLSGGALHQNVPGRPPVIVQILFCRDAEVEFVPVHGNQRAASSKTQTGREGKRAGYLNVFPPGLSRRACCIGGGDGPCFRL